MIVWVLVFAGFPGIFGSYDTQDSFERAAALIAVAPHHDCIPSKVQP